MSELLSSVERSLELGNGLVGEDLLERTRSCGIIAIEFSCDSSHHCDLDDEDYDVKKRLNGKIKLAVSLFTGLLSLSLSLLSYDKQNSLRRKPLSAYMLSWNGQSGKEG